MKNKYTYLIKNTSLLLISNFSSKILVFLLVPIYTSVLTTKEYGNYDLVSSIISFVLPILTLNICEAIMRFLMDKSISKEEIISIGAKIVFISIIIVGVVLCIISRFKLIGFISEYTWYIFAFYMSSVLYQFMTQVAKGLELVKEIAISGCLSTIVMLCSNIILLIVMEWGLKGFFIAYILGQLVPVLWLSVKLNVYKYFRMKRNTELKRQMIGYSVPLIYNSLGWWVNSVSDRYFVAWFCGVAINGIYSISYKIPSILNVFQNIFIQAWQISAVKEYEDDKSESFYANMLLVVNACMTLICSALIIFTKQIASILFANDFYSAWKYVPVLLVSQVFNTASGTLGPIISASMKTVALGKSAIMGAVINIVGNVLLIPMLGAQGAAIATAISSFVIFYMRKRALTFVIDKKIMRIIYASWVILICQGYIMLQFSVSAIVQFSIFVLLIIINWKSIFSVFLNGIQMIKKQ